MGPSQASLELTVVALGIVAITLVAVVVGLSIRFYTENARIHRETAVMHANMGETMEKVLKDSNKVIVGQDGQGVVPYLPLPELQKRAAPATQGQVQGAN